MQKKFARNYKYNKTGDNRSFRPYIKKLNSSTNKEELQLAENNISTYLMNHLWNISVKVFVSLSPTNTSKSPNLK